jgi:hypothetical protein
LRLNAHVKQDMHSMHLGNVLVWKIKIECDSVIN